MRSHNIVSSFTNNPENEIQFYGRAYFNAASLLSEKFLIQDGYRDYDAYPIVFLYRHSLELYLKSINYLGETLSNLMNVEIDDTWLKNSHKFEDFDKYSISIINIFFDDLVKTYLISQINKLTKLFKEIDENSFSYRYPIDKMGNPSTKRHQVVNIDNLAKEMKELVSYLEFITNGLEGEINNNFDILN